MTTLPSSDEQLSGFIDSIVYVQPDNGFTVARLKEPRTKELIIIVGMLPSVQPGESVMCRGVWKVHPSYGRQFEVKEYSVERPFDLVGIQRYLESKAVKGIGPSTAEKIVQRFGEKTLEILDKEPHRLKEIGGLGDKRLEMITSSWQAQTAVREVMLFLRTHGMSTGFAQRIYKVYGEQSIEKVKENPYALAKEVHGIGFKVADALAIKLGYPLHSPARLQAGIEFVLWELSQEGHTCFLLREFLPLATQALEVEASLIEAEIQLLSQKRTLVKTAMEEETFIWLGPFWGYEQGIAKDLARLLSNPQAIRAIQADKALEWVQTQLSIEFALQQKAAVIAALTDKVHIITGGPGTGKSTITNGIIAITSKLTPHILLAAPTGRAAKRLTQITGRKASTIHALLEVDFKSKTFKRGRENPLECDLLIVDEASMIDTPLLFHLLRALPCQARLLIVGDIDQLPSVGPGTVLRDLIHSELIGVTRLTEIFRQAKGSKIITNAHKINQGEFPDLYTPERSDFHFIEAETPEAIQEVILRLVTKEIPALWGFDPLDDIQVLSPMKKGPIGVEMLNDALQALLNTEPKSLVRQGRSFAVGDKVMQLKNNYDNQVYNGDIGKIQAIDLGEQTLGVLFEERLVEYEFGQIEELTLAYACSVHKFQGSECPCVVIPIHVSHYKLLHRNLLYTGVTRGKKQLYLVGTKRAIGIAVSNNEVQKRYTGLVHALKNAPRPAVLAATQLKLC